MLIPSRVFFSFQLLYSSVLTGSFLYFLILYHCGPLFFSQVHEYPIDHYFKFFIFTISVPLKDFHGGTGLFFHLEHISLPLPFLGGLFVFVSMNEIKQLSFLILKEWLCVGATSVQNICTVTYM